MKVLDGKPRKAQENEPAEVGAPTSILNLTYELDSEQAKETIEYQVIDAHGQVHTGELANGQATVAELATGACQVTFNCATLEDEQKLIALRASLNQALSGMISEVKAKAALQDALFEQASFFEQWAIRSGAVMTGVYQGGETLISGLTDLAALSLELHYNAFTAAQHLFSALQRADIYRIKVQLETLLSASEKSFQQLSDAFDLLVIVITDEPTREMLVSFPENYVDAHSIVDKHRIGGIFLFEILLAVLTAGAGAAVSAASKSKYVVKANQSLLDIADILKRKQLNQQKSKALVEGENALTTKAPEPQVTLEAPKFKKFPPPVSLTDAFNRLKIARQSIKKHGYRSKYSDDELLAMAQAGKVANERFHVRFMEERYLQDRETPKSPLSGKLGGNFEGKNGTGIKYWSTTFDQIESADTDPKLIAEILGLTYNPKKTYTMILIDSHKAAQTSGAKSITPTFKELGNFAKEELDTIDAKVVDSVFTHEYQATYQNLYRQAEKSEIDIWDKQGMEQFGEVLLEKDEKVEHFKSRLELHNKLGSNEDFLGTGVTQNNLPNKQKIGVVEIFTLERKPQTIAELRDSDAITIVTDLKLIGK